MKYLCLIYDDEKNWVNLPQAEMDKVFAEHEAFSQGIKAKGQYVGGEALHPSSTATTVRVRNGKTTTTDGPFAETKEQLGGFVMIEAADIDAAVKIAATIPMATIGTIEVRPVRTLARLPVK
jgi:hypothetical protein